MSTYFSLITKENPERGNAMRETKIKSHITQTFFLAIQHQAQKKQKRRTCNGCTIWATINYLLNETNLNQLWMICIIKQRCCWSDSNRKASLSCDQHRVQQCSWNITRQTSFLTLGSTDFSHFQNQTLIQFMKITPSLILLFILPI